jgi:prepilin-type N-terminal cleavage/methylation domain-containing protein
MIPLSPIKRPYANKHEKGFTLVELIVTLVLVGIIGTFTTLFMYTGLNGYLRAKDTSEGALKAQIALDRIGLELRDINRVTAFIADVNVDYTSVTLPGDRRIRFFDPSPDEGDTEILLSVDGNENLLLDKIYSFSMSVTYKDLNYYGDNVDEVEAIDVSFTIGDIKRPFRARIFPRHMVRDPNA